MARLSGKEVQAAVILSSQVFVIEPIEDWFLHGLMRAMRWAAGIFWPGSEMMLQQQTATGVTAW
jgi:hypothetical protein